MESMLTRFAPSPTGLMHLGNIRTALLCYLYAKRKGGKFMLRIDDTDTLSCKLEYQESIKRDLSWLGLNWDISIKQSQRFQRYDEIFNQLSDLGLIYKCYETPEELEIKRKMLISRGLPPIYNRPSSDQIKKYETEGRKPHFRFKINSPDVISWHDEIRGEITFAGANLSDPVVKRTNGLYTYMLPSAIDDIDYKITHVLRGEDHITNTAIQIQMIKALSAKLPKFAHLSLLKIGDGKLSKRDGALGLYSLREKGLEPMAISSYLATVGSSSTTEEYKNLEQLIANFNIEKFSCSSISLNINEINKINKKLIRNFSFEEIYPRLEIKELTTDFWDAVRFNINTLEELKDWWRICKTPIISIIKDRELIDSAYDTLPLDEWNETTWDEWIAKLKKVSDKKGKDLFMPLRLAITGTEKGPELAKLLPMIERSLLISRLKKSCLKKI